MKHSLIMAETPAPCQFKCDYCYVPPGFDRRGDKKVVTSKDYLELAKKTGADKYLFWLCSIGEPFMMSSFKEIITGITAKHKACVITNLSYHNDDTPEYLCDQNTKNIGMYWSVHWNQMIKHGVLDKTITRVKKMLDSGIRIWPTVVAHPSYFDKFDDILACMKDLGLRISFCRYRIGQADLAKLKEEENIENGYRNNPHADFKIWDITPNAWKVRGGTCEAGVKQVIVDAWWRITCCHGDGNMKVFGTFPEDIDKIKLTEAGICKSTKCPCKHSMFFGVNKKYPYTFADILDGWDDFYYG
jgi:hypothetical protein